MRLATFVVAALLLLAPARGMAQDRHGFWLNGALGYGSLGCEDCGSREVGLSGGLFLGVTRCQYVLLVFGTTGFYKDQVCPSLTVGTLDARLRLYTSRRSGFFLTTGLGLSTIHASIGGLGSATETGVGFMLGLGYDIPLNEGLSLTPFWNGFAVRSG